MTRTRCHQGLTPVHPKLEEHVAWRKTISPLLTDVNDNVMEICQYGFEEMVNNVVSHSGARQVTLHVNRTAVEIRFMIKDDGIGIFQKIQNSFGFDDPRHALLELSKGKMTSDPDRHTGEGIFFTSRMFDRFIIYSGTLFYSRKNGRDDWMIEVEDTDQQDGTIIILTISPDAPQTSSEIYDRFAVGEERDFSKTHVPIKLAKYEKELLLSRSQARRVLARFERFSEVLLDFADVEQIGQAFADEIFRVYRREHPVLEIMSINASAEVQMMINRVIQEA